MSDSPSGSASPPLSAFCEETWNLYTGTVEIRRSQVMPNSDLVCGNYVSMAGILWRLEVSLSQDNSGPSQFFFGSRPRRLGDGGDLESSGSDERPVYLAISKDSAEELDEGWQIGVSVDQWGTRGGRRDTYNYVFNERCLRMQVFDFQSTEFPESLILRVKLRPSYMRRRNMMDFQRFLDKKKAESLLANCALIAQDNLKRPLFVNKDLLAMHSPVFKSMFYGDFVESHQEQITLGEDVRHTDLLHFLDCLYIPQANITAQNVGAVLTLADRFQCQVLIKACERYYLSAHLPLTPERIRSQLQLADRYHMKNVIARTVPLLTTRMMSELLQEPTWVRSLNPETADALVMRAALKLSDYVKKCPHDADD